MDTLIAVGTLTAFVYSTSSCSPWPTFTFTEDLAESSAATSNYDMAAAIITFLLIDPLGRVEHAQPSRSRPAVS
jgi:cation transport ATPase